MKFSDNPFTILGVTPRDDMETIAEAEADKAFADEEHEERYEDARACLASPMKRLTAEILYLDERKRRKGAQQALTDREAFLLCCMRLTKGIQDDTAEEIVQLDTHLSDLLALDIYAEPNELEIINRNRRAAGIATYEDEEAFRSLLKDTLLEAAGEVFTELFKDNSYSEQIVDIANEVAELTIGRKAAGENVSYGPVIEKFLSKYSIAVQDTLTTKSEEVLSAIEQVKSASSVAELEILLFNKVRDFDYVAQPLQLYLADQGSSEKQEESVEVAVGLRELAVYFHNERELTELSIAITELVKECFSELPFAREKAAEDDVALRRLLAYKKVHAILNAITDDIAEHIIRDNNHVAENASYLKANKDRWVADLRKVSEELQQLDDDKDDYAILAGTCRSIAAALTWGEMFAEALEVLALGRNWAQNSGDTAFIIRYDEIEQSCRENCEAQQRRAAAQVRQTPQRIAKLQQKQQPQQQTTTKDKEGGIGCLGWLAILFVLYLIFGR